MAFNYASVVNVLDQELAKHKALADVAAVIKEIGSTLNAIDEVKKSHAAATSALEATKAELVSVTADVTTAKEAAAQHIAEGQATASGHMEAAKADIARWWDAAKAEGAVVKAKAQAEGEAIRDGLQAQIDELKGNVAATQADHVAATQRLVQVTELVTAAEARLAAVKAAASQIAA